MLRVIYTYLHRTWPATLRIRASRSDGKSAALRGANSRWGDSWAAKTVPNLPATASWRPTSRTKF